MKNFFTISLIIFYCLTGFNSKAVNVHLQNNLQKPVMVSIAYSSVSKEFKGWYTVGWFKVEPGETIDTKINVDDGETIFFYGETNSDGKGEYLYFGGKYNFLVSPFEKKFRIKNSNMKYVKEDNVLYTWKGFVYHKVDFGGKFFITNYTIPFNR